MLADELDYVVGVDPHRDAHALAIVHAGSGAVGSRRGHGERARVRAGAAPRRAGCVGRRALGDRGHGLLRCRARRASWRAAASGCSRSGARGGSGARAPRRTRSTRSAPPAACSARTGWRARAPSGEREALRALMVARAGPLAAKKAGLCQLRALLVTGARTAAQRAATTDAGAAARAPPRRAPRPAAGSRAARHADRATRARPPRAGADGARNATSSARSRRCRQLAPHCSTSPVSARSPPRKC